MSLALQPINSLQLSEQPSDLISPLPKKNDQPNDSPKPSLSLDLTKLKKRSSEQPIQMLGEGESGRRHTLQLPGSTLEVPNGFSSRSSSRASTPHSTASTSSSTASTPHSHISTPGSRRQSVLSPSSLTVTPSSISINSSEQDSAPPSRKSSQDSLSPLGSPSQSVENGASTQVTDPVARAQSLQSPISSTSPSLSSTSRFLKVQSNKIRLEPLPVVPVVRPEVDKTPKDDTHQEIRKRVQSLWENLPKEQRELVDSFEKRCVAELDEDRRARELAARREAERSEDELSRRTGPLVVILVALGIIIIAVVVLILQFK